MATKQITKKKVAPKIKAAAKRPQQSATKADPQRVFVLVCTFTTLCIVFAAVAFWRYN